MTPYKSKLVTEGHYAQPFCDMMTDTEAETLWRLHQMYNHALDATCDRLTSILGYDKSRLSDEQKADIVAEVEDLTQEFDEAEIGGRYHQRDVTPLMLCLKRYHELSEQIMNVRDVIIARLP